MAGSWMDGGAISLEVSVLKILISVFHNSFAFYLFSFNIAISLNSKYVTSVCDNSTFLVPLHLMLSATQDNKQIIYLMCVFYFFIFLIDNVFFHFISWTRDKYLYNFFFSDNLLLEHHFYTFYYTLITTDIQQVFHSIQTSNLKGIINLI